MGIKFSGFSDVDRFHVTWRWPNEDVDDRSAPYSWGGWLCVYARRWQYWPPWACTNWYGFTWMRACDGERRSRLLIVPLLGGFVWFFNEPCGCEQEEEESE